MQKLTKLNEGHDCICITAYRKKDDAGIHKRWAKEIIAGRAAENAALEAENMAKPERNIRKPRRRRRDEDDEWISMGELLVGD